VNAPNKTPRTLAVDDTLNADQAYRLASEGTRLLWQGDFHNAKQLMQAMARRIDQSAKRRSKKPSPAPEGLHPAAHAFHLHRQAQAHRARILGSIVLSMAGDYSLALRRAPNVQQACTEAWGPAKGQDVQIALRELLGVIGSHEWRKKGVEIPALGAPPNNRIHPYYGVFSPVRGEYIDLVAQARLPSKALAFDIGVGTGVLSAVLAKRGVQHVVATDQDPQALACAQDNLQRLGLSSQVSLQQTDLFPADVAPLIVCNPPWVPARPSSLIEHAVYDEGSAMLKGFLSGLRAHLAPDGEGWLILSDLAEHLHLRSREELLQWINDGGLRVMERLDIRPRHAKATDTNDPLHKARAAEITSLWRLAAG
jgi:SAM-dependent methyltransferase